MILLGPPLLPSPNGKPVRSVIAPASWSRARRFIVKNDKATAVAIEKEMTMAHRTRPASQARIDRLNRRANELQRAGRPQEARATRRTAARTEKLTIDRVSGSASRGGCGR